jgi:predicted nucleic acid-binding protein
VTDPLYREEACVKVFLDANILFSASDEKSATRQLLDRLARRGEPVTSPHAWEEARRNIERKRPHLLPGLESLRSAVTITHAFKLPPDLQVAEKDKPILAGAIGAACTHLWTSDRLHFGASYGTTLHGVTIVSSIQLADELKGAGPR